MHTRVKIEIIFSGSGVSIHNIFIEELFNILYSLTLNIYVLKCQELVLLLSMIYVTRISLIRD